MNAQSIRERRTDKNNFISFASIEKDSNSVALNKSTEFLKILHKMPEEEEWRLSEKKKQSTDELGYTHQFLQQYYKGVKVEGGEFIVNATEGRVETVLGHYKQVGEVDVKARITEKQALKYAIKYIGAEIYKWQIPEEEEWIKRYYNNTYYPKADLVIVYDMISDNGFRLAYRFDIAAQKPYSRDYVVDRCY
jgi:Zn-dependent metalloprotease